MTDDVPYRPCSRCHRDRHHLLVGVLIWGFLRWQLEDSLALGGLSRWRRLPNEHHLGL